MPERSALSQVTQIGVESPPGTAVATTRRLQSFDIMLGPEVDSKGVKPSGQKFRTTTYPAKESVTGDIEGDAAYNELAYLFSSVMSASSPAPSQIMDGGTPSGGYTWTFTPSPFTEDAPKTYTVENGSATRAHRAPYVIVDELSLSITRDSVELGGSVIAQVLQDGVTLTASPASALPIPIRPTEIDIYLDTTSAGLGTTKLTRAMGLDWKLGGRYGGVWPLDSSKSSWVNHVETEPDLTVDLTVEADAQGMGLLTDMRAGSIKYLRILATGPTIYTGGVTVKHKLTVDMAVMVDDTGGYDEQDGLEVIEWNLVGTTDPAWGTGKAVTATLITTLSAL